MRQKSTLIQHMRDKCISQYHYIGKPCILHITMGTTGSQRARLTCSYRAVYIPVHPPEKENLKYFDKLLPGSFTFMHAMKHST